MQRRTSRDADPSIDHLIVSVDATIRDAMQTINDGACEIALAVDGRDVLVGTVTDGDLRRALLAGNGLDDAVKPHVNPGPLVVAPNESRASVIDLMQARRITQVPVVDAEGHVVGLHLLSTLLGRVARPNLAVVMAGGRGTRLGPLTEHTPKPMLEVAGRPILERIVLHLAGAGITTIALSVNHLRDQIEAHFGDGSGLGCRIVYLREDPDAPLGTAGSLTLLEGAGLRPEHPIVVMNGDLVTQVDLTAMLRSHEDRGAAATVAARRYRHQVPFGVLDADPSGLVRSVTEKPTAEWWASAGIYVLEPRCIERIPPGARHDVPELLGALVDDGAPVALWPLEEDWHDIGRADDLRRARGLG